MEYKQIMWKCVSGGVAVRVGNGAVAEDTLVGG